MINLGDERTRNAYENIRRIMRYWGFGEAPSSIYALLAISDMALTGEEISIHTGYAYSSIINEVNRLIREGLIERERKGRKYAYRAITDFLEIIKKEMEKLIDMMEDAKNALIEVKNNKVNEIIENIEESLMYLRKVEGVARE